MNEPKHLDEAPSGTATMQELLEEVDRQRRQVVNDSREQMRADLLAIEHRLWWLPTGFFRRLHFSAIFENGPDGKGYYRGLQWRNRFVVDHHPEFDALGAVEAVTKMDEHGDK